MNQKWNEKTTLQKVMEVIAGIAFLVYIVFEVLDLTGQIESADLINCAAIGVVCVCEAISFWNTKRSLSYIAIVGAICLIAAVILFGLL